MRNTEAQRYARWSLAAAAVLAQDVAGVYVRNVYIARQEEKKHRQEAESAKKAAEEARDKEARLRREAEDARKAEAEEELYRDANENVEVGRQQCPFVSAGR